MSKPTRIIIVIDGGIPTVYASNPEAVDVAVLDNDVRDLGELAAHECKALEDEAARLTEIAFEEPSRVDEDDET